MKKLLAVLIAPFTKKPEIESPLDFGNFNVFLAKENGFLLKEVFHLNSRIEELEKELEKLKTGNLF
jgi:hypothetical protein